MLPRLTTLEKGKSIIHINTAWIIPRNTKEKTKTRYDK